MSEGQWVDRADALVENLTAVGSGPLSVDTEADSLHHYKDKVCLIQLSFGGRHLLVDPLGSLDLSPLAAILQDSGVRKILHGADYDVRMLRRDFGIELRGLFDTMVAARLCGERAWGLSALVERWLGVRLDKRFQKADWSRRPLPAAMRAYAVLDTRYLQELAVCLERELERTLRTAWAEEEFRRVEALGWAEGEPVEAYLRVKGTRDLSRRQLGVLRELATLRVAEAERRDRPLFHILPDEVLCDLARVVPRTADDLHRAARLPEPWRSGARTALLLECVDRAISLPEDELPPLPSRPLRIKDPRREARVREGLRTRDHLAVSLGLDPAVLGPRAVVEAVLDRLEQGQSLDDLPNLRLWQREILGPALRRV